METVQNLYFVWNYIWQMRNINDQAIFVMVTEGSCGFRVV